MEFRQLKIFCAAAHDLNFTKTATKLNYTQSNITSQIKQLESNLKVRLFERLGKRIVLSNDGRVFYKYANEILKKCEEAACVFSDDYSRKVINIASTETSCVYHLPPVLRKYRAMYPFVEVRVDTISCDDLPSLLRSNQIDVGLVLTEPLNYPDIVAKVIANESMVFVASPDHDLAIQPALRAQHFSRECLILTSPICGYRPTVLSVFRELEIHPASIMQLASVAAIKECLCCGLGFAVLPRISVQDELRTGKLVELSVVDVSFNLKTQLFYHKDKWLSPIIQGFIDLCEPVFESAVLADYDASAVT